MSGKKGIRFSLEHRGKISEALKGHPCYKNPERSRKLSESHKGISTWNKGLKGCQVAWNKGKPANKEAILKMVNTRKSRGNYKHSEESIVRIKNSIINGIANRQIRRSDTDIERKVKSFLEDLKIHYIFQYNFQDKFLVDFALPERKLVIECDGEYWHRTEKQQKRDSARDAYITACRWLVLRLKGDYIYGMANANQLLRRIEKLPCGS